MTAGCRDAHVLIRRWARASTESLNRPCGPGRRARVPPATASNLLYLGDLRQCFCFCCVFPGVRSSWFQLIHGGPHGEKNIALRELISGRSAGCGHDGPPLFNGMTLFSTDIMDDDHITNTRGVLAACAARGCRKPLDERRSMVCCAGRRDLVRCCCDHLSIGHRWIQFSLRCSSSACAERAVAPNGSRAQTVSDLRAVLRVGARECVHAT